jgi:ferric-dicitrate binding protein FerR (iron transport regulator)
MQLQQAMKKSLLEKINAQHQGKVRRTIFLRPAYWWVAASLVLMLGTGAYLFFYNRHDKGNENSLASRPQQERFKNDISPANQRVILTLSDGSTQVMDSIAPGTVTLQGNTRAIKQAGSIAYLGDHVSKVVYNTLTTEKGRTFHLQLADGTGVWLDALSSVRFPTAFPRDERMVEVTGQAYFEVAKDVHRPFRVRCGNQVVQVLGTQFNINSYNRMDLQTTLVEGAVKVAVKNSASFILNKPGQQTRANDGVVKLVEAVDVDEVMAWKDGRFQFNGSNVEQIMDQISRWYNLDIVYKDKINETFVADIKRDLPVSKLLALLEMTKQIRFVIEGNKITVAK